MSGAGELAGVHTIHEEPDGDRTALVLRRFLRHPPSTVWRALTDPEQIRQWYLTSAKIDGRVGGALELNLDPVGVRSSGQVVAWEPPHRFEYDLNTPELPELNVPAMDTRVRWELRAVEGGTELTLTQRRLSKVAAGVLKVGLPFFLLRLEAQLDGRELPRWESRVQEARRFKVVSRA